MPATVQARKAPPLPSQRSFDFEENAGPCTRKIRVPLPMEGVTCVGCISFRDCGGLDQRGFDFGDDRNCFKQCRTCNKDSCDYTCPFNERLFASRCREVNGIENRPCVGLLATGIELPRYVTTLSHEYRRSRVSALPVVAIPIEIIFNLSTGRYRLGAPTASAIREVFHLSPQTEILVECIDHDDTVEGFWHNERSAGIIEQMAHLGVAAATVPNFSYFEDAPRTQVLYNRRRSSIVAERMTSAGIPPIPHLNALTPADWKWWAMVLADNPQITYVAKEFRTGLRGNRKAVEALAEMDRLQQRIGRRLHPLLFSGRRLSTRAARLFATHTVVDCHPFQLTMSRRMFDTEGCKLIVHKVETPIGAPLDDLFEHNLEVYTRHLGLPPVRSTPPTCTRRRPLDSDTPELELS